MEAIDTNGFEYDAEVLNDFGVAAQAASTDVELFEGFSFNKSREAFSALVKWLSDESRHMETFARVAKQAASVRTQPGYLLDTSRLLDLQSSGFLDDVNELTSQFESGVFLEVSDELRGLATEALRVIDADAKLSDTDSIAIWADALARDTLGRND